jgi:hypothetical protein
MNTLLSGSSPDRPGERLALAVPITNVRMARASAAEHGRCAISYDLEVFMYVHTNPLLHGLFNPSSLFMFLFFALPEDQQQQRHRHDDGGGGRGPVPRSDDRTAAGRRSRHGSESRGACGTFHARGDERRDRVGDQHGVQVVQNPIVG